MSALATRITIQDSNDTMALPMTTWFVDGLAVSTVVTYEEHRNTPSDMVVTDLQSGRSFPIVGNLKAERIALQIAKAYLFDIIALFGTERLPETALAK